MTYALWLTVLAWASTHGYSFTNLGSRGNNGVGASGTDQEPVTAVSWRDAIAWCNAFSEYEGLSPCYYTDVDQQTVYRTPSALDSQTGIYIADYDTTVGAPYLSECVDWSANGYRLPTAAEWEYAARYNGVGTSDPGNQHSGYTVNTGIGNCVWYNINATGSTHPVGSKTANTLGIFDMSGNVAEWCWDWDELTVTGYATASFYTGADTKGPTDGGQHVIRGGGWSETDVDCVTATRRWVYPWIKDDKTGFRLVRKP